jgi:transcriptional regulator with XRE-family HTH domain
MTLRQLREDKGLTQEELAAAAGCEQTTISQLECGKVRDPRYSTVAALAKVLKTSTSIVMASIAESEAA